MSADFGPLVDIMVKNRVDLEMLRTAFANMMKIGPVEELDAQKGYRIKLADGEDGPVLSRWYPHPESGGQTSSWIPMSKGQIVGVFNPNGDAGQGLLIRGGFSGDAPPPSDDLFANVVKALGLGFHMKDGVLKLEGVRFEIDADLTVNGNVDFRGGHVRHNDVNIGDDHGHETAPLGPPGPPIR